MEREVIAQHRRLDALLDDVRDAFQGEDPCEEVREVFGTLAEALEVHFDQEERLYYPPIGALCPDRKPELLAITEAHKGFRARLGEIAVLLKRGDVARAARAFDGLADAIKAHEAVEEQLLSALEQELVAAR